MDTGSLTVLFEDPFWIGLFEVIDQQGLRVCKVTFGAVIHILAVSPDSQGKGIGSEMIREAVNLAKINGMKAIRLDALASNTPAHGIYKRLGFEYRGKQHLYAENTGWTDFFFFEYNGTI